MRILFNVLFTSLLVFSWMVTQADEIMCINFSSPEIDNTSCNQDNGRIKVNHDGTAPFTYSWSHDSTLNDSVAENLPAGTYKITVTDVTGCTADMTVIVLEKSFELSGSATQSICAAPNGTATVNIQPNTGGTAPFTYLWDNNAGNQTTATATGLSSGTYKVTVTDADGCTSQLTFNVPNSTNGFGASVSSINGTSCFDGNDGSATVMATGGNGSYTYEWFLPSNPDSIIATGATATGLTGARYVVRVRDANGNGCTFNTSVNIPEPDSLRPNLMVAGAIGCRDATGRAFVIPAGGTAPYSILWSTGSVNDTIENLLADQYSVMITDSNNCVTEQDFWVTTLSGPFFKVDTLQKDNCGLEEGIVGVTIETGKAPFKIPWNTNNFEPSDTAFFAYHVARTNGRTPYAVRGGH